MGRKVRFDGGAVMQRSKFLDRWAREDRLVEFCPEVEGGLTIPRSPSEICQGNGVDVLNRSVAVVTADGRYVTNQFLKGAKAAVNQSKKNKARLAILKENSPSCGCHCIYDGTFSGKKIAGMGVTTAALQMAGVKVFTENEISEAAKFLNDLEE